MIVMFELPVSYTTPPISGLGVYNIARTADPNQPEGYSTPDDTLCSSIKAGGKKGEGEGRAVCASFLLLIKLPLPQLMRSQLHSYSSPQPTGQGCVSSHAGLSRLKLTQSLFIPLHLFEG